MKKWVVKMERIKTKYEKADEEIERLEKERKAILERKKKFEEECKKTSLAKKEIEILDVIMQELESTHTEYNVKVNVSDIVGIKTSYGNFITWNDYIQKYNTFDSLQTVQGVLFDESAYSYNGKYYLIDGMHRVSFLKFYSEINKQEIELNFASIHYYKKTTVKIL